MNRRLVLAILSLAAAFAPLAATAAEPRPSRPATIGVATLQPDGTLVLKLNVDGPPEKRGDSLVVYKPDNPRYREILAHIGDIKPGEKKPIAPWSTHPPQ